MLEKMVRYTCATDVHGVTYEPLQGYRHPPATFTWVTGVAAVPIEAVFLICTFPRTCTRSAVISAEFSMQRSPRT